MCGGLRKIRFSGNWKKLGGRGSVEGNTDVVQFQMEETKNDGRFRRVVTEEGFVGCRDSCTGRGYICVPSCAERSRATDQGRRDRQRDQTGNESSREEEALPAC